MAKSEKYSLGNFAEIAREKIGIIDQTHGTEEVGDITDRAPEVAQAIYAEVAKAQEEQKEAKGQAQGDE